MSVAKGDRKETSTNLETAKMLKGLCVYTIQICKNEKNFPKRDRWILTAPIVKCAVKAYQKVFQYPLLWRSYGNTLMYTVVTDRHGRFHLPAATVQCLAVSPADLGNPLLRAATTEMSITM